MNRFIAPIALSLTLISCGQRAGERSPEVAESIQLSGAFALYPMAVRWAEEFRKLHPEVRIDISGGGAGKGMTDALAEVVDLGMVSREVYDEEIARGAFAIAAVKDAVVPTVNANNPALKRLQSRGLTADKALALWSGEVDTWGQLLDTTLSLPVHVFTRSDACGAAETFAAWMGRRQEDLRGVAVFGDPGVAAAVQKDKVGIGFNNIAYAYDFRTGRPYDNIAIVPLDADKNGVISADEDFYATADKLIAAIADGRFPSPPARDLYFVSNGRPRRAVVREFLHYVLTDGQRLTGQSGYISLSAEQAEVELKRLKGERDE